MSESQKNFSPAVIEHPNARARFLYARELFRAAEPTEHPNSQRLIDQHEQWLRLALGEIGIDGPNTKYLSNVFRNKPVKREFKERLHEIEIQLNKTTNNILQALLWYEAPELSSWNAKRLQFRSQHALCDQDAARRYMLERKQSGGKWLSDWNSPERHKSLIVGYSPRQHISDTSPNTTPLFTLVVNEHYVGVEGSFNYTDTKRQHIGVYGCFDPQSQVIAISFPGQEYFYGWDQIDGTPMYILTYIRNMIRDVQEKVKKGEEGFIGLSTWRSGY